MQVRTFILTILITLLAVAAWFTVAATLETPIVASKVIIPLVFIALLGWLLDLVANDSSSSELWAHLKAHYDGRSLSKTYAILMVSVVAVLTFSLTLVA